MKIKTVGSFISNRSAVWVLRYLLWKELCSCLSLSDSLIGSLPSTHLLFPLTFLGAYFTGDLLSFVNFGWNQPTGGKTCMHTRHRECEFIRCFSLRRQAGIITMLCSHPISSFLPLTGTVEVRVLHVPHCRPPIMLLPGPTVQAEAAPAFPMQVFHFQV